MVRVFPSLPFGLAAALNGAVAGCGGPTIVQVRASLQPGVPLSGIEVAAVPFNSEALLDSLAQASPAPQPTFAGLEDEMRRYRRTEGQASGDDVTAVWLATRDSVKRLSRALDRMDRRAPAYREAYSHFRDLYGRYAARGAARDAGLRKLFATDRNLAERAARAADSLRAWEHAAYRAFPELAAARAHGRTAPRLRTDSAGITRLELPAGRWWLTARLPDPDNPFQEWYWNVPIAVAGGLPFAVPLLKDNAANRWRH